MSGNGDNPTPASVELSLEEILDRYERRADDETHFRNPFKFLDAYGPEDGDIFFGREAEAEEALRHFYRKKHLLLYGESGSGKTSLIQCGLRGKIAEEDAVFITLRSHADAWRQLRETILERVPGLAPEADTVELLRELAEFESRTLVLVFDQFEELFIAHGKASKRHFARELRQLIDVRLDLKLLFVIRQEYLALLTELEREVPSLFENRLWLRRMSDEDAQRAVESACQVCGVGLEAGLAGTIVRRLTVEGNGVELPYLQVVMDRLYRKAVDAGGNPPFISSAAYESEGRIEDILARFMEEEVERLPDPDHGRHILKAMVTGEGTKKVVSGVELARDTLNFGAAIPPRELNAAIRQLIQSRILREDPQRETLELRHDTLAATVFAWMSGLEKELLEIRQALQNRHKEYLSRNRAAEALLDAGFLHYLQPYLPRLRLAPEIADYMERSRSEAQLQQRHRKRLLVGGFALSFTVLLAFSTWNLAERAKVALLAKGLLLGKLETASEELANTRPVTSVLLGLNILQLADKDQIDLRGAAEDQLRSVVHASGSTAVGRLTGAARQVAVSDDGLRVAALASSGEVRYWNLYSDGSPIGPALAVSLPVKATRLALSADGRWLGLASTDHGVWLLATNRQSPPMRLGEHATAVHALSFSGNGSWLVSAGGDKRIRLWPTDAATSAGRHLIGANSLITQLRMSRNGRWLVSAGMDGSIRVWGWNEALSGSEADAWLLTPEPVTQLSMSADAAWIGALQRNGELLLWQRQEDSDGKIDYRPRLRLPQVRKTTMAGDQGHLATLGEDGTVSLYLLGDARVTGPVNLLQEREAGIEHIHFSPAGDWLIAGGKDQKLRVWQVDDKGKVQRSFVRHGHGAAIADLAMNSRNIVSSDESGEVRRWQLEVSGSRGTMPASDGSGSPISALAFHPGEALLYTGNRSGELRRWAYESVQQPLRLGVQETEPISLGFLDGGDTLVSMGRDGSLRLWDARRAATYPPDPKTQAIDMPSARSAEFSPNGRWLAVLDQLGRLRLWSQEAGDGLSWRRRSTDADEKQFGRLRFDDAGNHLALFGWDERVHVLNLGEIDGPNGLRQLDPAGGLVADVQFGPGGDWLLSRDIQGRAKTWALAEGTQPNGDTRPIADKSALQWYKDILPVPPTALAFSTDGNRLASLDREGHLTLLLRGQASVVSLGPLPLADTLGFSRDDHWLTAQSADGTSPVGLCVCTPIRVQCRRYFGRIPGVSDFPPTDVGWYTWTGRARSDSPVSAT